MSEEPRRDAPRHRVEPEDSREDPQARRRRSLEDEGGVRVADLLSKSPKRTRRPVPSQRPPGEPPQQATGEPPRERPGRQQAAEPPQAPRSEQPTIRSEPVPPPSAPVPPPRAQPAQDTGYRAAAPTESSAARPGPPSRYGAPPTRDHNHDHDPLSLTNELEPVSEEVQRRRDLDNSIARFSAVHDEVVEEERRKRSKRSRYLPWVSEVDELDDALTFTPTTTAVPVPDEPSDSGPEAEPRPRLTRLRAKKQRRSERSVFASKVVAAVVSALILLGCGVGWGAKEWVNGEPTRVAADSAATVATAFPQDDQVPPAPRT